MAAIKPIFIRIAFAEQYFVKNASTELHKNPNNDLVTDRQTWAPHKTSSALRKEQLQTETQFVTTKCGARGQPTAFTETSDSDGRFFFRVSDISSEF